MEEIDLKELIGIFWKRKFLIIIVVVIFAILGLVYSNISKSPIYESSATLILTPEKSSDAEFYADYYHITDNNRTIEVEKTYHDASRLSTELSINTRLLTSSTAIATSKTVANKVIENLNLEVSESSLLSSLTVTPTADTQTLIISVTDSDPNFACSLANEFAKVFIEEAGKIYNRDNFHILDAATPSTTPTNSTSPIKNIIIFAFVGAVLVAGYILVIFMFDTSVKNANDIEKQLGLKVLATIIDSNKSKNKDLKVKLIENTKTVEADMFRNLRTNLQFMENTSDKKVILVTSPEAKDGKSFVSANLAMTIASLSKKVLVIDANMRRGLQHAFFNLKSNPGLSELLTEESKELFDYVQETNTKNLYIISAGSDLQNPSDLLASERMELILEKLKESFDIIIIDTPNCLDVSDALVLSKIVDYTILVVSQNKTKFENLENAKKVLENIDGSIAGIVLNKVPHNEKKNFCSCLKKDK